MVGRGMRATARSRTVLCKLMFSLIFRRRSGRMVSFALPRICEEDGAVLFFGLSRGFWKAENFGPRSQVR